MAEGKRGRGGDGNIIVLPDEEEFSTIQVTDLERLSREGYNTLFNVVNYTLKSYPETVVWHILSGDGGEIDLWNAYQMYENNIMPYSPIHIMGRTAIYTLSRFIEGQIDYTDASFWGYDKIKFEFKAYLNEEIMIADAIRNFYSLPLMKAQHKHLLYDKSKRVRTNMSIFKQPNAREVNIAEFDRLKWELDVDDEYNVYFPVTRYAAEADTGLFHPTPDSKGNVYCGTFYYMELESTTLLYSPRNIKARNKTEAMTLLLDQYYDENGMDYSAELREMVAKMIQQTPHLITLPDDGMMRPYDYYNTFEDFPFLRTGDWVPTQRDPGFPFYVAGEIFGYYALEDDFDQPLCILARELGYTCVILTHMIGSNQIVSEVLDVRDRQESFANLVYLNERLQCRICTVIKPQYMCGDCNSAVFCSEKCQRIDWHNQGHICK